MPKHHTNTKISPFAKLLIISGILFALGIYVVFKLAFRPDPFTEELQGSGNFKLDAVPNKKLQTEVPIQLPNSD